MPSGSLIIWESQHRIPSFGSLNATYLGRGIPRQAVCDLERLHREAV